MTQRHSPIEYGDSLRLQPQQSRLVDMAVVKFVNRCNDEPDDYIGFDDPLFHLPAPAAPTPRVCAFRRWRGADWWMVFCEDARAVPIGCTVTRRVTILPDAEQPNTLDVLPDLVVTKGGARFTLPEHESSHLKFGQNVPRTWAHPVLFETSEGQRLELEECLMALLVEAWESTSELDPDEATVFVSS